MGSGGVAIAALPTVICLKVPFSDGLGGADASQRRFLGGIDDRRSARIEERDERDTP